MKEQSHGTYYDGKSSVPQNIELNVDSEKAVLFFDDKDILPISWNIKDVSFTKSANTLTLQHGNDPIQTIVVTDVRFTEKLLTTRRKMGYNSTYETLLSYGYKVHLVIALAILGLIGLGYFFLIPWVGEKSVALIPESYDDKLGSIFFDQSIKFSSIDTSKTKALNLFANELSLNNRKKIKFTVIDSEIVNAYALPDGNIVIFTGILDSMQDYDELVGLIGHEVAHINNRHSMKMMCRNLSGYLFVSAILGDVNGVMAIIGDNVNTLRSLSFSREFEHQADSDGLKIVVQNNVNPKGMSNLFKRLDDRTALVPEFLSSHPITTERITFIDNTIKTATFEVRENPKLKALFNELKQ